MASEEELIERVARNIAGIHPEYSLDEWRSWIADHRYEILEALCEHDESTMHAYRVFGYVPKWLERRYNRAMELALEYREQLLSGVLYQKRIEMQYDGITTVEPLGMTVSVRIDISRMPRDVLHELIRYCKEQGIRVYRYDNSLFIHWDLDLDMLDEFKLLSQYYDLAEKLIDTFGAVLKSYLYLPRR